MRRPQRRNATIALAALALAGCVGQAPTGTPTYDNAIPGRFANREAAVAQIGVDMAQCEYQERMAYAARPAPQMQFGGGINGAGMNMANALAGAYRPDNFDLCMRAKGWRFAGYR